MITILILIIFTIIYYKKINKVQEVKYNKLYYSKNKRKKIKNEKPKKKIKEILILDSIIIIIWLIISFIINYVLINNYESSMTNGFLTYNVLETHNLKLIESDDGQEYYVYGYKTIKEDITDKRAYYYVLDDGTEITKSLNTGIILNYSNDNYEATGNLVYDSFLNKFFIQFYSYQYKTVYANEDKILLIESNK